MKSKNDSRWVDNGLEPIGNKQNTKALKLSKQYQKWVQDKETK